MRFLRKLLSLEAADRRLVAAALATVIAARAALWLLPFRVFRRLLARFAVVSRSPSGTAPARVAWAVEATARRVPRATCLVRAAAAQVLLARHGCPSDLRIGVARGAAGIEGHAWLESQGAVVIGGRDLGQYSTMS